MKDPNETQFPTTVVVLAGGLGTRLRGAVADRPKVLAPAAGRPFLDYVLTYLARQRMETVILSAGYLANQVAEFAGDGSRWGLHVRTIVEAAPLGTAGALRLASSGLGGPFFALNGDTLFLADLRSLWEAHLKIGAPATVALLRVDSGQARGCVTLCEDGKILSFDEKPEYGGSALVNGGIYVLTRRALAGVQPGRAVSIEREVFPTLVGQEQLGGQEQRAYFADIGTPESLAAFERDVLEAGDLLSGDMP